MLHGSGEIEYLNLSPEGSGNEGTFRWTGDKEKARNNAESNYGHSEGIDVKGGQLLFVCKTTKRLFILDLDSNRYKRRSTRQGLFDGAPDQIERVLEGSTDLLYFTEEGGKDAGVHARKRDGSFYTILESPVYNDETSGLSFSPDGKFMYIAYQHK
jgi:sugar lactone lactonase YvrE